MITISKEEIEEMWCDGLRCEVVYPDPLIFVYIGERERSVWLCPKCLKKFIKKLQGELKKEIEKAKKKGNK